MNPHPMATSAKGHVTTRDSSPTWLFQCSCYAPQIQVPCPPSFQYTLRHRKCSPFDPSQASLFNTLNSPTPMIVVVNQPLILNLLSTIIVNATIIFQVDGPAHT